MEKFKQKSKFSSTQYVIIAKDQKGQKVATLTSTHDLNGTKQLAQSLLNLTPTASYADIFSYAGTGEEAKAAYTGNPVECVKREEQQGVTQ